MKKVFLILALIVAYGASISNVQAKVVAIDNSATTVLADVTNDNAAPEGDKDKKEKTVAKAEKAKTADAKAKGEGCATAKSEGCATAKAAGCETAAKASCCEGKAKSASALNESKEKKQ